MSAIKGIHLNLLRLAARTSGDLKSQIYDDVVLTKCVTDMMLGNTNIISEEQFQILKNTCPMVFSFLQEYGGIQESFITHATKTKILTHEQFVILLEKAQQYIIDQSTFE